MDGCVAGQERVNNNLFFYYEEFVVHLDDGSFTLFSMDK
jgi:hypothetical protein